MEGAKSGCWAGGVPRWLRLLGEGELECGGVDLGGHLRGGRALEGIWGAEWGLCEKKRNRREKQCLVLEKGRGLRELRCGGE